MKEWNIKSFNSKSGKIALLNTVEYDPYTERPIIKQEV